MSTVNFSSSNRTTFSINPLHDNGSNFADYELKVKVLCAAKGILKFLESWARKPTELVVVNGIYMKVGMQDKPATEEEIKSAETKMDTYEQNKGLCKHILLSSVSPCWWASSSDMLIYPSYTLLFLLFLYFLYIIDPPLHTLTERECACACTTIALASLDWSRLFDGYMIYNSHVFTSILSISNVHPPTVRPIMTPHTTWSGTSLRMSLMLAFLFSIRI